MAPRLNAPGRLGDASEALSLLIETDQRKARAHAETCNELNIKRQAVQEGVLREHPAVRDCAVVVQETSRGLELVAYAVWEEKNEKDLKDLKDSFEVS